MILIAKLVKLSIILFRADEVLPWAREGLLTPVRGLPEPPMFPARAERRVVLRPPEVGPLGVVVVGLALALLRLAGLRSTSTASSSLTPISPTPEMTPLAASAAPSQGCHLWRRWRIRMCREMFRESLIHHLPDRDLLGVVVGQLYCRNRRSSGCCGS